MGITRKGLALALGALMTAGSAGSASAASQIDFSGYYEAYFLNHFNQTFSNSEERNNDSYFINRLNLDFGFHPTDEVSVYWTLRAPHSQRWGDTAERGGRPGERSQAETLYVYGEVVQDWGTVSIGRLADSFTGLGLATLGWAPDGPDPTFTGVWSVFSPFVEADGARWANRWDNGFQLVTQFNRLASAQEYNPVTGRLGDEQTDDLYTVEGAYFWDGGGASLGLSYRRDHSRGSIPEGTAYLPAFKAFFLNPALSHSWGDFSAHFEGQFGWGKDAIEANARGYGLYNPRGYGLYMDFDYNYGDGNVNLAGWWISGSDRRTDETRKDLVQTSGAGFAPLLVAYNEVGNGWNRSGLGAVELANFMADNAGHANHWAVNLSGAHAFTENVTLGWALAYLALNKTAPGQGKNIGVETDLALRFKLLDNLSFTTSAGYLFSGKAFEDVFHDQKAADAYTWYNTLTFSF